MANTRILQVIPYFPPAYAFGGPVQVAYQMCAELVKRGHDVTVYTTDARDFTSKLNVEATALLDGVKVYYFKNISMSLVKWSKLFLAPQMLSVVKDKIKTFDIVHLHEYRTLQNAIVHRYSRKYNVPYVLEVHGSLAKSTARLGSKFVYDVFFGYRLLRDASKVIALTSTEAQQYMAKGVPNNRIAVIPNGINLTEYTDLPAKGSFKKKLNIAEDKKTILYLGRIHKEKGIDFLIKAYAYLVNHLKYDRAVLVVAGPDEGYLNALRSLINSLKINDSVLFTGILSEREKRLAYVDSDVVINVEPKNVFGMVPLEAAACSTPVVVSRGNAISKAVREGKFGFSVRYGDARGLAFLLRKMFINEQLRISLGRNGREYVSDNFDWKKIVEKLEQVYRELLAKKKST